MPSRIRFAPIQTCWFCEQDTDDFAVASDEDGIWITCRKCAIERGDADTGGNDDGNDDENWDDELRWMESEKCLTPRSPSPADAAVRHFLMVVGATVAVFGALVLAVGMVVQSPVTWGMGGGGLGVGLVAFLINLWADAKTDDDTDGGVGSMDAEEATD